MIDECVDLVRDDGRDRDRDRSRGRGRGRGRHPLVLALQLLLTLLTPLRALAETALLLPPSGDDALKPQQQEAQRVLTSALEAQAVRIVTQAEVSERLGGSVKECRNVDCAQPLLLSSDADVAAAVAIWGSGTPRVPTTVFVTLVDRRGDRFPAKTQIEDKSLASTIKQALLEARALQLLGPGPWLRVRSEPEGARVTIDGNVMGTAPVRAPIQPGRHRLELRFEGYRLHAQTVDIPPSDARQIDVDVELSRREDEEGQVADASSTAAGASEDARQNAGPAPHTRPIVGPLLLGGAGAALLIYDLTAHFVALADGSCLHRQPSGTCTEQHKVNVAPTVVFGVAGAGAIVGAVLWYVLGDRPDREQSSAHLASGLDGLSLRGHF